ncbi:MAG: PD40 domain-containing protein, partial [Candidatus Eremiobacteraeota bacterium]|nr:PD40 domain-containing protein [Candidatus Eremiobacteraeota bacterium]
MKLAAAALAAALMLLAVAPAASEGTQPVKAEDLFALALIDDAQISPDGKNVAFVVERLDGARNRNRSAIWSVPADASSAPRQITQGERDESPRWSPDRHTLAFVRRAAGKPQIYALDLAAGGEAHALTTAKDGANEPEWSHDGKRILYQGIDRDKPVPTHVDWHAAGITAPAKHEHTDIRTISTLRFETNGLGYTYDRRAHLWVMNADGTQKRRLTSGPYSARNAHWSPDDATIAYNAYLAPPSPVFKTDLYTIAAQGGTPVKVPLGHLRQIFGAWSHDGARLWFQTSSTHDGAALPGVASVRRDGSDERQVVAENEVAFRDAVLADMKEDGRGCGPLLDPLDRWFVADVSVRGGTALARFDATTGKQTVLAGGDREIAECS